MVGPERESKRLKLEIMPGIASGIISASKSASYEESVALQIVPTDCDLSEFFESESNDEILTAARKYDRQQTCLDTFNTENNEDSLRNAFFKGLQTQDGFYFPKGADENNCGEYKEMELKALFKKFGEQFNEDVSVYDKEQGFLVTTTSKPDLCVLRELPGGKTEVKFGEVKHGRNCTKESASRQDFLYLYSLLYFFRVKLGIPVDTVYGFVICGPKCQKLEGNEYAVGLLKLSSPSGLGDNFTGRQYIKAYKTSDSTGLQLLAHFFTNGKVSNVESALQDQRDQGKRAPFYLPFPARCGRTRMIPMVVGNLSWAAPVLWSFMCQSKKWVSSCTKSPSPNRITIFGVLLKRMFESCRTRRTRISPVILGNYMSRYEQEILPLILKICPSGPCTEC